MPPLSLQVQLSFYVGFLDVVVIFTVQLNNDAAGLTGEVDNVQTDWMLPTEL